jgi:uncharacterized protein with HEPN domain
VNQSRDELYLQHVLDVIEKIERYAAVGHDEFIASPGASSSSAYFTA